MLTFQEIISNLQNYWSKKGCLVMQPYDMEMGAATFNPFTTLKALGKDPWNAVFTQPCRRPSDGRYDTNRCNSNALKSSTNSSNSIITNIVFI